MSEMELLAGVPTFLELVERFKTSRLPRAFTQLFMQGGVEETDGDEMYFEKLINDRKLAPLRGRNADAFAFDAPDDKYIRQGLIHVKIKERIHPQELFLKAAVGSPMKSNAANVIARAAGRLYNRGMLTREYCCAELLQNASGVTIDSATTDFAAGGIQNSVTLASEGTIPSQAAGAAWTTAATEMLSGTDQIPEFLNVIEANGYEGYRFICDRAAMKSIMGNTEAKDWLTTNGGVTVQVAKDFARQYSDPASRRGGDPFKDNIISGLGGIEKWNVWGHGYENRSGTFTKFVTTTQGILLPNLQGFEGESPLGFAEGPSIIPSPQVAIGVGEQAATLYAQRRGPVIWAYREVSDAGALVLVYEDHFAPVIKDENAVLLCTGITA